MKTRLVYFFVAMVCVGLYVSRVTFLVTMGRDPEFHDGVLMITLLLMLVVSCAIATSGDD